MYPALPFPPPSVKVTHMKTIGLICAIPAERKPLTKRFPGASKQRLTRFTAWNFRAGTNRVILVESGIGTMNAAAATTAILELIKPDTVLNIGFCGALRPGIHTGQLVLAQQQYSLCSGQLITEHGPDPALNSSLLNRLNHTDCCSGSFITTDSFKNKNSVSPFIPAKILTPVLEMEGAAVIRLCHAYATPVAALRVVSDPYDEDPTALVTKLVDNDFAINRVRAIATLLRNPGLLPQAFRLARNARKAGNSLADAMDHLLERLE